MSRRRRRAPAIAVGVGLVVLLAACSHDGRELRRPVFDPPSTTTTTIATDVLPSVITIPDASLVTLVD